MQVVAESDPWDRVLRRHRRGPHAADGSAPPDAAPDGRRADPDALFDFLLHPPPGAEGCVVLGRLAQTLDGRIATSCGNSQWIGGQGDVLHTHRLRALCDAVVVGGGTVSCDDPRLTTREAAGPDPVRVVLDPNRRLHANYRVFGDGPPTLLAVAEDAAGAATHGAAEVLPLPRGDGGVCLRSLLRALTARGLRRIFVEGGGMTVSRFLAAGLLDRLHVTIAPIILGSGRPAFTLPEASRIADGLRFAWTAHPLGHDILLDIPLDRATPRDGAGPGAKQRP